MTPLKVLVAALMSAAICFGFAIGHVAYADLGYNPGSVTTIFDFLCFGTKHCSAHVPINSSGTEIATPTSPLYAGPGSVPTTLFVWTSGTPGNTTQSLFSSGGWPAVLLQLNQTSPITGGAVTIEGTFDGTFTDGPGGNPRIVPIAQVLNPNTFAPLTNPYTLVASTNQPFLILPQGYQAIRIRLTTVITGAGTVTPFVSLRPDNPTISGLLNPLAAGTAIIGKVGVDQTTPGITNAVQPIAGASGGATVSSAIAPATPAGVNLKASAGTLYAIQATTIQATPVYVKFYNSASAPTCGSGTPIARFMVPTAATAANGAGSNIPLPISGIAFSSGIGYCVTGALPDADATAITANNTLVNIQWQ